MNGFDSIWSDTNFGIIFHIVKVSTWLNYFLDKEHIMDHCLNREIRRSTHFTRLETRRCFHICDLVGLKQHMFDQVFFSQPKH